MPCELLLSNFGTKKVLVTHMKNAVKTWTQIGRDPRFTAKAIGLRYVSDTTPGYSRKKAGKGWSYYDPNGILVKDKILIDRFRKLVIPPAYTRVWISPYENSHLLFTGIDAAGRKQYRYHAAWNKVRNQTKYHRMQHFADFLPAIRAQVDKDLSRHQLNHEKVVALVVRLMELTSIRVGNESYKKLYGSFGLTTLMDHHVKIDGAKIWFQFKGKKGVLQKVSLKSKRLARIVKQCRDIPGKDLFQYYNEQGEPCTIGSGDINDYLKAITGEDFTAKDFRTWAGSINALYAIKEAGGFTSMAECKRKMVMVIDKVALNLGNTRTVCKKYYIHPTIMKSYEEGTIFRYTDQFNGAEEVEVANLSLAEQALLQLMEKEQLLEAVE